MDDLVDIAISAIARSAAEALGLTVSSSITHGTRIRAIPRDEAEIAVACRRDWGFSARIVELNPPGDRAISSDTKRAA
jgi:hypothetical protein